MYPPANVLHPESQRVPRHRCWLCRGEQATDAGSLLFVSRCMSWMTAPLCFSFLLQAGTQTLHKTAFSTLYSVAPLPGFESVARWLPMLIVLVAGLEVSHTYKRLVESCGMDVLLFADADTEGRTAYEGKQEVLNARTRDWCTHADVTLARATSTTARVWPGGGGVVNQSLLHAERLSARV